MISRNWLALVTSVVIAAIVSACGNTEERVPVESALTEEQVTEMLANALHAYNSGEYENWSRDWSETLRGAIPEAAFLEFRETQMKAAGQFNRLIGVELRPGQSNTAVRWVATAEFEKATAELAFGMTPTSTKIEGVFFNTVSG